ncbi:MAG TPA: bifunctional glycosyltransferase family 2 protein/class I SAM-dependent methyltransferase [Methylomusa anaerophila]|uniref:Putative glycosyltransferase EpsH n=1 Tax=Methylomusa anaerophila TaxID=1930071 RepID=A0A348AGF5_9FIRM|nr:bifunctional glycosyltransferase family 2 protein/class I SAM-dependent methyltransferase [Methylomusa anaerophila]BBB90153.1 putative glycosyltransferase EpsH [Methylomusa anaerophila]HML88121.1 bifunctional glycosyltransferase family 2 protein/class I SAM-dependent methyltransferase [Methylomusa anaerophila]
MKTSIVILTYNQLSSTEQCVESIRKFTEPDQYEIIIIDDNSADGTVEWLRNQPDLKIIYNEQSLGVPIRYNQGIKLASGDNILLIDHDVVVTHGWLTNLMNCLYSDEKIGAVGPVTNYCAGYQNIRINYKTMEEMQAFGKTYNQSNAAAWEERLKLAGYCLLIKKEVVDSIGLLDELFTPGSFEDDDYSFRIRMAGYKLMLCKDTFVHHFGNVHFKIDNVNYHEQFKINRDKFAVKWGFDSAYSTSIRQDLIGFIDKPKDQAIKVLEIGCACGGTLLQIKNIYPKAELYGIELNEQAALSAKLLADVIATDIEKTILPYLEDYFDYIILGDVLEHMVNPWKALANLRPYLNQSGQIFASIPNVMHFSVLRNLLMGSWTYEDAGILDRTHMRFFTLNEIEKMFTGTGYKVHGYQPVLVYETEDDRRFIEGLANLAGDYRLAEQYRAYQYLVKASKEKPLTGFRPPAMDVQQLILLLCRIEQGINPDENLQTLIGCISEEKVTAAQIVEAVMKGLVHKEDIVLVVVANCYKHGLQEHAHDILEQACKMNPQNTQTALNLLRNLDCKDKAAELTKEILEAAKENGNDNEHENGNERQ